MFVYKSHQCVYVYHILRDEGEAACALCHCGSLKAAKARQVHETIRTRHGGSRITLHSTVFAPTESHCNKSLQICINVSHLRRRTRPHPGADICLSLEVGSSHRKRIALSLHVSTYLQISSDTGSLPDERKAYHIVAESPVSSNIRLPL